MATAVKQKMKYTSYGNVAYDPAYVPGQEAEGRTAPLVRPRERVTGRAKVQVRQAGYVAPTAVIGFILVGVMAVLLVMSYVQVAVTSNELVKLRSESAQLTEEHNKLLAAYEQAFDLKTVEEAVTVSGTMVQPRPGQIIPLDLSEPDSVRVYDPNGETNAVTGLWNSLTGAVQNIVAFFGG